MYTQNMALKSPFQLYTISFLWKIIVHMEKSYSSEIDGLLFSPIFLKFSWLLCWILLALFLLVLYWGEVEKRGYNGKWFLFLFWVLFFFSHLLLLLFSGLHWQLASWVGSVRAAWRETSTITSDIFSAFVGFLTSAHLLKANSGKKCVVYTMS